MHGWPRCCIQGTGKNSTPLLMESVYGYGRKLCQSHLECMALYNRANAAVTFINLTVRFLVLNRTYFSGRTTLGQNPHNGDDLAFLWLCQDRWWYRFEIVVLFLEFSSVLVMLKEFLESRWGNRSEAKSLKSLLYIFFQYSLFFKKRLEIRLRRPAVIKPLA